MFRLACKVVATLLVLLGLVPAAPTAAGATTSEWARTWSGVAYDVATAPSAPDVVYAATSAGVLRSDDGGATWAGTGTVDAPRTLAVDRRDPDVVYVRSMWWEVFRSDDGGATWQDLNDCSPCIATPGEAIDLVATADHLLLLNSPAELTWSLPAPRYWSAHNEIEWAEDPEGNQQEWDRAPWPYAVAATDGSFDSSTAVAYVATDRGLIRWGGGSWPTLQPVGAPWTVDVTPDGTRVLAGTHLSVDGGTSWRDIGYVPGGVRTSEVDATAAYVGTHASSWDPWKPSVYRSTDGATWEPLGLTGAAVNALAVEGGRIVAATDSGLFRYAPPSAPPGALDETVTGGDTVTTDHDGAGATAAVPVHTAIAVPDGVSGQLTVTPEPADGAATGYSFFGTQLSIEGPAASVEAPYTVTFTVDGSLLGGIAPADVQVFRNGVAVGGCTHATSAIPDPCVASRGAAGDGDALITVRTSHFSTWNLGRLAYDLGAPSAPVKALPAVNQARAGSTVPLRFSLGGDRGLDVLAAASPTVEPAVCKTGDVASGAATPAQAPAGLTYADGLYQLDWKTTKGVTGCRDLVLRFRDGSELRTRFVLR